MCKELLNVRISKSEQTTDWGKSKLTLSQQKYAATDVLYLHEIMKKLNLILKRENRINIADACFEFISYRADLDLNGWQDVDIFKH